MEFMRKAQCQIDGPTVCSHIIEDISFGESPPLHATGLFSVLNWGTRCRRGPKGAPRLTPQLLAPVPALQVMH